MPAVLNLHLEYETLDARFFSSLILATDTLYRDISMVVAAPWSFDKIGEYFEQVQTFETFKNYWFEREYPNARLQIDSVHTGQSITIKFRSGWHPSIQVKGDDIEVALPRNLAVPFTLVVMILGAVHFSADTAKTSLEVLKVYRETVQIDKENQKLDLELEEMRRRIETSPPAVQRTLEMDFSHLRYLLSRPEYAKVTASAAWEEEEESSKERH